ncbi:Serine/threonine-protein kinase haspin, partial [Podochytrium sp. JEL0797]
MSEQPRVRKVSRMATRDSSAKPSHTAKPVRRMKPKQKLSVPEKTYIDFLENKPLPVKEQQDEYEDEHGVFRAKEWSMDRDEVPDLPPANNPVWARQKPTKKTSKQLDRRNRLDSTNPRELLPRDINDLPSLETHFETMDIAASAAESHHIAKLPSRKMVQNWLSSLVPGEPAESVDPLHEDSFEAAISRALTEAPRLDVAVKKEVPENEEDSFDLAISRALGQAPCVDTEPNSTIHILDHQNMVEQPTPSVSVRQPVRATSSKALDEPTLHRAESNIRNPPDVIDLTSDSFDSVPPPPRVLDNLDGRRCVVDLTDSFEFVQPPPPIPAATATILENSIASLPLDESPNAVRDDSNWLDQLDELQPRVSIQTEIAAPPPRISNAATKRDGQTPRFSMGVEPSAEYGSLIDGYLDSSVGRVSFPLEVASGELQDGCVELSGAGFRDDSILVVEGHDGKDEGDVSTPKRQTGVGSLAVDRADSSAVSGVAETREEILASPCMMAQNASVAVGGPRDSGVDAVPLCDDSVRVDSVPQSPVVVAAVNRISPNNVAAAADNLLAAETLAMGVTCASVALEPELSSESESEISDVDEALHLAVEQQMRLNDLSDEEDELEVRDGVKDGVVGEGEEDEWIDAAVVPDSARKHRRSFGGSNAHEMLANAGSQEKSTLKELLALCDQREPVSFETALSNYTLTKKLGEATFSEVYSFTTKDSPSSRLAVKVMPFGAPAHTLHVNGSPQISMHEVLQEALITKTLSEFERDGGSEEDAECRVGSNFVELVSLHVCQGEYSEPLLEAWDLWTETKVSENDRPDFFPQSQLYAVIVLVNGGTDLEHFTLKPVPTSTHPSTPLPKPRATRNARSSTTTTTTATTTNKTWSLLRSILLQTILSLHAAEQALSFEHRDLHWGNILCQADVRWCGVEKRYLGSEVSVALEGVKVTIIDYTLSRCE